MTWLICLWKDPLQVDALHWDVVTEPEALHLQASRYNSLDVFQLIHLRSIKKYWRGLFLSFYCCWETDPDILTGPGLNLTPFDIRFKKESQGNLDRGIYYAKYYCGGGDGRWGNKIKMKIDGEKWKRGNKKRENYIKRLTTVSFGL